MADNVIEDWEIEVTEVKEFDGKYEDLKEETVATPIKATAKTKTKKQILNEHINRKQEEERLVRESDFVNTLNLFGENQCDIDLKEICKRLTSSPNVTTEDVRGMIDTLTVIMNNKIKDEKPKKTTNKKPTKNWSKSQNEVTNIENYEYDDFI